MKSFRWARPHMSLWAEARDGIAIRILSLSWPKKERTLEVRFEKLACHVGMVCENWCLRGRFFVDLSFPDQWNWSATVTAGQPYGHQCILDAPPTSTIGSIEAGQWGCCNKPRPGQVWKSSRPAQAWPISLVWPICRLTRLMSEPCDLGQHLNKLASQKAQGDMRILSLSTACACPNTWTGTHPLRCATLVSKLDTRNFMVEKICVSIKRQIVVFVAFGQTTTTLTIQYYVYIYISYIYLSVCLPAWLAVCLSIYLCISLSIVYSSIPLHPTTSHHIKRLVS